MKTPIKAFILIIAAICAIITSCTKDGVSIDEIPPFISITISDGDGFSKTFTSDNVYTAGKLYLKYSTEYTISCSIRDTSGIKDYEVRLNSRYLNSITLGTSPTHTASTVNDIAIYSVNKNASDAVQFSSMLTLGSFETSNPFGNNNLFGIIVSGNDYAPNYAAIVIPCHISSVNFTEWVDNDEFTCGESKVLDIDGNFYNTVLIGNECWTSKNLIVSRYRDFTPIPNLISNASWSAATSGAWVNLDNDPENDSTYGKFYNWFAASSEKGLCPAGWRVPTKEDWTILVNGLGGASVAGEKLKAEIGWIEGGNGTNSSGFKGFPNGYRDVTGTFIAPGIVGAWWSSIESSALYAWQMSLIFDEDEAFTEIHYDKRRGYSCRCIKD